MLPENWKWIETSTLHSFCEQLLVENRKDIVKKALKKALLFSKVVESTEKVRGVILSENFEIDETPDVVCLYTSLDEKLIKYDKTKWLLYIDWVLKNIIEQSQFKPLPILFVNSYFFCKKLSKSKEVVKFLDKKWFFNFINDG